jgi:predicted naringenin-chalcone synthase
MTLSGYVPELIEQDFQPLVERALNGTGLNKSSIQNWCIHPGGKRILEAVARSLELEKEALAASYSTMCDYGNMSSPTILFVLKQIMDDLKNPEKAERNSAEHVPVFGAAFGPGLTMETFVATY